MKKSDVNGDNTNDVYKWLKAAASDDSDIRWNFARIFLYIVAIQTRITIFKYLF